MNTQLRLTLASVAGVALFALLTLAIWYHPTSTVDLPQLVANSLAETGTEHPITAVLLNFRSYDTLLEVAVLLVAVVITLALAQQDSNEALSSLEQPARDSLVIALTRRLVPLVVLVGVYVLWAGSYQPGGAFQAGALIAAAGVLLRLAGWPIHQRANLLLRVGLTLGLVVFIMIASIALVSGQPFLTYPERWAGELIFAIETVLTLSIALTLLSLFLFSPEALSSQSRKPSKEKAQ
ncbi:MAG: MnhB domain-containing protein [Idiomarina sp.]|nr:MnhB domain-containing protein [Idiomarina sp.]